MRNPTSKLYPSTRLRTLLVLLAAGLLGLAPVACGGGDDDSSSGDTDSPDVIATSDLGKDEWIAEADAICQEESDQLGAVAEERYGDEPPEGEEMERFVRDEIVPHFQSQADRIRELGAPAGDEEVIQGILDKLDQGAAQLDDDPALADDSSADLLLSQAGTEIQEYGATVCGT